MLLLPNAILQKKEYFAMWTCNNGQKVITGPLKNLLVDAAHFMIDDMTSLESPQDVDLRKPECINEIVETLKEDVRINPPLNYVFEKLSPFEKIYSMHYVLSHLFNDKNEAPNPSLWMEATIDALFETINTNVIIDIETEADEDRFGNDKEYTFRTRELIVKSCKEHFSDEADPDIYKKDSKKIKDIVFWSYQIDDLKNLVLFSCEFDQNVEYSENGAELEGEHLPKIKIEKKIIAKMIKDILKMKS